MPGINPPTSEALAVLIGQMNQRIRALETQQQSTYTDATGRAIINTGLAPGSNPAKYGFQFIDPATGNEQMWLGETPGGTAGSQLIIRDSVTGAVTAIIGALPPAYNRADGSAQPGLAFYREDGTVAAILGDANATTPPYKQSFQIADRSNNIIVADDTNSGLGLARPHLPANTLMNTNASTWPATNSTSWTTIASAYVERQTPKVNWAFDLATDASTNGQVRFLIASTQVGTTQTLTGGAGGVNIEWDGTAAYPAGVTFGATVLAELQAQVTSGTGKIYGQCLFFQGTQS
jgi:hypothetical protein